MAKISALVIPATIDTSGIDKGINQIKSKMSRVTGQSTGGSGSGGAGHSANITPMGGANPWGGGSPVGSAMAAAFGASIAARNGGSVSRMASNRVMTSWGAGRSIPPIFAAGLGAMTVHGAGINDPNATQGFASSLWKYSRSDQRAGVYERNQSPTINSIARAQEARRIANLRRRSFRRNAAINKWMPRYGGVGSLNDIGLGGTLGGIGVAAAAYGAWDFLNPQNQEQRWSNSWDFRGSQNYSSMVGARREAMKPQSKQMGFFQSIDVGASQARGDKSGPTNVRNIGNFLGGAVQGAGSFIGAATEGPLAAAGYMMGGGNTPMAQAYTEGMEVLVGGAMNSMIDGLKSIFN
jgi:hypothetical protein